jgi:hypothetical protein
MEDKLVKDIANFRCEIADFTEEQLENKKAELQNAISKMIMDCDMVLKIAIIDAKLKEIKGE